MNETNSNDIIIALVNNSTVDLNANNNNDNNINIDLYSELQLQVLFALPILPALWSMTGSALILYVVLSDATRKLKRVYHRVLAAYSVIDIFVSLQYALSSVVVPKGTPGVYGAVGNCKHTL